jgi:hypothetical protein
MFFVAPYVVVGCNVGKASKMNDGYGICMIFFSHGKCITFLIGMCIPYHHGQWKYSSFKHGNYSSLNMATAVE